MFDRRDEGRAKTGKAAIGTISRRTERLVTAYLAALNATLHPDAILFRNRSGNPYREDTLADDFGAPREAIFPGDKRRLMDMRPSGTVEAIAGGAEGFALAAKMANSIEHSNALHRTYAPVDEVAIQNVDEARLRGRRKLRECSRRSRTHAAQGLYDVASGSAGSCAITIKTPLELAGKLSGQS